MNKKSKVIKTKDLFHDNLSLERIKHTHYACKDMSVKDLKSVIVVNPKTTKSLDIFNYIMVVLHLYM